MDIDPPAPPSSARKKPKFTPRPPSRRRNGPILPKKDDDVEADPELLRRIHERHGTRKPKVEKKSSGNVTMSQGAGSSSTPLKTQGHPMDVDIKISPDLQDSTQKKITILNSFAPKDGNIDKMLVDDEYKSTRKIKKKKKYKERWDPHSYYPITLPVRPLGSGDPEILNEEEFIEEKEYDESKISSASELGLLEENDKDQMLLFKIPQKLPLDKNLTKRPPVSAKGKEKVNSGSLKDQYSGLELPDGHVGKMLVYKSGAIKLKLGDVVFDVSSGMLDECAQNLTLMNTKSKDCGVLGQVDKQAVIIPDIDSILDDIINQ